MGFSESVKLKVKHLSAFRCCRCESLGVQVHHIIPEAEGGPDTLDNAAPLCPSCHSYFGANPAIRKEIRQKRDWYGVVERKYGTVSPELQKLEEKIDTLISMASTQQRVPANAKDILIEYLSNSRLYIDNIVLVANALVHSQFHGGSPCQMAGQKYPACQMGVMDVATGEEGVICEKCGLFIPAG